MKYMLCSFNTKDYQDDKIEEELNEFCNYKLFKSCEIVAMNLLANGWTRFLFKVEYK